MKKNVFFALGALLALIIMPDLVSAQSDYLALNSSSKLQKIMSYYSTSLDNKNLSESVTPLADTYVNEKVLKSFNKTYKNAANTSWYTTNKGKMYIAYFDNEGRKSKALFERNGYMVYAISDGNESNMTKDTRRNIKSNYVDYNITQAKQITADDLNAWVVNLQDENNIVVLSEVDGALYELQNFNTSPVKKTKKSKVIIGTIQ